MPWRTQRRKSTAAASADASNTDFFAPVSKITADRGFVSLCDDFVTFFAKGMFFFAFCAEYGIIRNWFIIP